MAYINLGQVIYPIGSIYMSYTGTSPASLFGGNWTAISGRFYIAIMELPLAAQIVEPIILTITMQ